MEFSSLEFLTREEYCGLVYSTRLFIHPFLSQDRSQSNRYISRSLQISNGLSLSRVWLNPVLRQQIPQISVWQEIIEVSTTLIPYGLQYLISQSLEDEHTA